MTSSKKRPTWIQSFKELKLVLKLRILPTKMMIFWKESLTNRKTMKWHNHLNNFSKIIPIMKLMLNEMWHCPQIKTRNSGALKWSRVWNVNLFSVWLTNFSLNSTKGNLYLCCKFLNVKIRRVSFTWKLINFLMSSSLPEVSRAFIRAKIVPRWSLLEKWLISCASALKWKKVHFKKCNGSE